jgi:hypothetical protein
VKGSKMKEKFDAELHKVKKILIGPVETWKEDITFDIYAETESNYHFSIRFHLSREEFEDKGIFYFGLKGKSDE